MHQQMHIAHHNEHIHMHARNTQTHKLTHSHRNQKRQIRYSVGKNTPIRLNCHMFAGRMNE